MNQGRIWCVVNPTIGLPLFLGSVAGIALIVHAAVLTHTTWYPNYYEGAKAKSAANVTPAPVVGMSATTAPGYSVNVTPVAGPAGQVASSFVVTVTPTVSTAADSSTAPSDKLSLAK